MSVTKKYNDNLVAGAAMRDGSGNNISRQFNELNNKVKIAEENIEYCLANIETNSAENYCVGLWNPNSLAATSEITRGSVNFALAWYPWLIDHNTEASENGGIKPKAKLMKNNWFRTVDGDFSPAVSIPTNDYIAVDNKVLYRKVDGELVKFHDAVEEFDHIEYYLIHGVEPLYDSQGNELYVRKPWDTIRTDLSIMIGREDSINVIDNMITSTGYKARGIVAQTIQDFDGCHVAPYVLHPTGICPSPSGTIQNKTINFFITKNVGDNNSSGFLSLGSLGRPYAGDGLYPRTNDAQQISNMSWARANNVNNKLPYPFAEGGYHALNAFLCCMEAAYGTKYIHAANKFSSGCSSNDACNNEATWLENGGIRYKLSSASSWFYAVWSSNTPFYYNASEARSDWSNTMNQYGPKWRVNEASIVASYAAERHITEGHTFDFMGKTYWYETPSGTKGLLDGEMNARIYRKDIINNLKVYDASGNVVEYDIEIVLRCGLIQGCNLSGDIYAYFGGGYELCGIGTIAQTVSGNEIIPYIQPDQKHWKNITATATDIGTEFGFEQDYIELEHTIASGNNYTKNRSPYVPYYKEVGGSISTGECNHVHGTNYWSTVGKKTRIGVRFRGLAIHSTCSPRYLSAAYYVGYSSRYYGCSAQCLLDVKHRAALMQ